MKPTEKPGAECGHSAAGGTPNQDSVNPTPRGKVLQATAKPAVKPSLTVVLRQRERRWCLPYGRWTCGDGRQVLFDRRYCPVAEKYPDKPATLADHFEWVPNVKHHEFFYDDATPERDKCRAALVALEDWGLTDEVLAALKKRNWKSPTKAERHSGVRHG
jgi:hypothetical protein